MTHKLAAIINYVIGAGLLTAALVLIKKKAANEPDMKLYGMSIKTISRIVYFGLAAFILLIIAVLAGLD